MLSRHKRLKNIIVKTAVKTALIVLGVIGIAALVMCFGFPQHVATWSEEIGDYPSAVYFTSLRYSYTGDGYDLARCVEDTILLGKDEDIAKFGGQFVDHAQFEEVCAFKSAEKKFAEKKLDYKQYVCRHIVAAKYNLGDFDGALALASKANGAQTFAFGNALMALSAQVCNNKDAAHAPALISVLEQLSPDGYDAKWLDDVLTSLNSLLS